LDEIVELAGGEFEAGVVGGVDVGVDVCGVLGGEEDDAGWVHHERGLQHEAGQGFSVSEVGVGGGGPALAEVPLDALLGGILDGLDRSRYLSIIVVNADGTSTPVPPLQ